MASPILHKSLPMIATLVTAVVAGCGTSQKQLLDSDKSQVQLRSMTSRAYDTPDVHQATRVAMATLQDLGFLIDHADDALGTVSATKLKGYALRMTVSIRKYGDKQVIVRASGQYEVQPVEDAEFYQRFFDAYSKSMFLEAHQVPDAAMAG